MTSGIRGSCGIIFNAVSDASGVPYDEVSFVVAVRQFIFGLAQPLFDVVALK